MPGSPVWQHNGPPLWELARWHFIHSSPASVPRPGEGTSAADRARLGLLGKRQQPEQGLSRWRSMGSIQESPGEARSGRGNRGCCAGSGIPALASSGQHPARCSLREVSLPKKRSFPDPCAPLARVFIQIRATGKTNDRGAFEAFLLVKRHAQTSLAARTRCRCLTPPRAPNVHPLPLSRAPKSSRRCRISCHTHAHTHGAAQVRNPLVAAKSFPKAFSFS